MGKEINEGKAEAKPTFFNTVLIALPVLALLDLLRHALDALVVVVLVWTAFLGVCAFWFSPFVSTCSTLYRSCSRELIERETYPPQEQA